MTEEMKRSAPNEQHHTSEARAIARVNKPLTSTAMTELTEPQRAESWKAALRLSRQIEEERPAKEAKLLQQKVENVREAMADAERKERKEAEQKAKYAQTKLHEQVEELDNLLDDIEDGEIRVDILRDQLGAWNTRKSGRKLALSGSESVLRKRLTKFLHDRAPKSEKKAEEQAPAKRKASTKEKPAKKRRNSDPGPRAAQKARPKKRPSSNKKASSVKASPAKKRKT